MNEREERGEPRWAGAKWVFDEFKQVGRDYGDPGEVARYDETHEDFRDFEREAAVAMEGLGLGGGAVLLEIGCGTGQFVVRAAKRCREVVATDISRAMLEETGRRVMGAGLSNVRLVHAGFLSYAHEGELLDAVSSTFALHHLPDLWKAVALRRVSGWLKPGGRLYLRDVVVPDGEELLGPVEAFIRGQELRGGDFLREDAEGHFREEHSTLDWVLEGMLERAGLRVVERTVEAGVVVSFWCEKR